MDYIIPAWVFSDRPIHPQSCPATSYGPSHSSKIPKSCVLGYNSTRKQHYFCRVDIDTGQLEQPECVNLYLNNYVMRLKSYATLLLVYATRTCNMYE